ncbi:unnamed protein product [Rhizoctonia solani]|uniref:CBM1 domain-containing protein n=1 Tax=Rhizoctonia solani TaxID=456999 RepID=A0A8H3AJV3_9AGAM|nr:unnamed protein product [Rhizoctonia solani]
MRLDLTSISVLLLSAAGCMATPAKGNVVGDDISTRAISGSQLYGCTGKNFGGHCETTPKYAIRLNDIGYS